MRVCVCVRERERENTYIIRVESVLRSTLPWFCRISDMLVVVATICVVNGSKMKDLKPLIFFTLIIRKMYSRVVLMTLNGRCGRASPARSAILGLFGIVPIIVK